MIIQTDVVRIAADENGEWIRVYDFVRGVTIKLVPADPANPPRPRATCFGVEA